MFRVYKAVGVQGDSKGRFIGNPFSDGAVLRGQG